MKPMRRCCTAGTVRRVVACVLPALAVAAGCGGSTGQSKSLKQFAAKLEAAVRDSSCQEWKRLEPSAKAPCSQLRAHVFPGFKVTGSSTYGSGSAVVDFRSGGEQSSMVARKQGASYTGVVDEITGAKTIGTKPKDPAAFDTAVKRSLNSLRTKDCNDYFKYTGTPSGQSKREACRQAFATAPRIITESKSEPKRIGGNSYWQFYDLRQKDGRHLTVYVENSKPAGHPIVGGVWRNNAS